MFRRVIIVLAVVGISGAVVTQLPDVKRYFEMRSM